MNQPSQRADSAEGGRRGGPWRGAQSRGRGRDRDHDRGRDHPRLTKLTQAAFLKFLLPPVRAAPEELLAALRGPAVTEEPLEGARAEAPPDEAPPDDLARGFGEVRAALAAAKSLLDVIPPAEFERFMQSVDLYRGLKRALRADYGMQIATNASLKMYELTVQMGLVVCEGGALPRLRAFCDAELPGAFVVALNHYVRTLCPGTTLEWLASSYYPAAAAASGDPTILGDTYGVYAGNRERWLMGPRPNGLPEGEPDVTGDVTDPDVVAALADAVHARYGAGAPPSGATLYTSDAGIDVSADYNRQEEITALLNYGQVLAGLLALAPGGHLVTKQYTFAAPFSRSLIALVAALFDAAYVTKPLTSRPANSEVYLVGKGFRGIDGPLADALLDRLAALRGAVAADVGAERWAPLLDPALYRGADEALLRAARQIHGRQQVAFLRETAGFYERFRGRPEALQRALQGDAARVQEEWLAANPVRRLREEFWLATAPAPRTK